MDTVTEKEMALSLAKMGGIGIIHRNLDPETQASMVKWVRRKIHYGGMVDKPITFRPTDRFSFVQSECITKGYTFTSFPIVDDQGRLLGLLTRDEMEFVEGTNPTLSEIMKPRQSIVTHQITNTEEAYQIMRSQKVKKLPVVDSNDLLMGLYVWNDVKNDQRKRDRFSLDADGHFLVGAAVGLGKEELARADLLVSSSCKLLVIDSSHGACQPTKDLIKNIRIKHGHNVNIIAGNIASYDSAMYLLEGPHRPDALKVGIGPGSICTTRSVTGHGIPQITAIYQVWKAVRDFGEKTGYYVPIIADGGIRTSGDIVKCLAVGASGVMLGSVFAGTFESPGTLIVKGGKRFKMIRGMGSRSAMAERSGSRMRYSQQPGEDVSEELTKEQKDKVVPEGVEGLVQFKGSVEKIMNELLGGIQAGLAHTGAVDIQTFQTRAKVWNQSFAGITEGKPHDITDIRD
jgi:IMP dehydrogenase